VSGSTPDTRLDQVRALLTRLENIPPDDVDDTLKLRIGQAWRMIEASEPDAAAPWTVGVIDPSNNRQMEVGVGYHEGHGFDTERGVATLNYALHRAALRSHAEADLADLYDRVHATRGTLLVTGLRRTRVPQEDRWSVTLDPGPLHGRPRLPKRPTVLATSQNEAVTQALWQVTASIGRERIRPDQFADRIAALHRGWEVTEARIALPTVFEVADSVSALHLTIPDTPEGQRFRRMLQTIRDQDPNQAGRERKPAG
jgi:hypothetical protein